MKFNILFTIFVIFYFGAHGQTITTAERKAKELRGTLNTLRGNYDVHYYHLDIEIDVDSQKVSGTSNFFFKAIEDINKLQFDLSKNLLIRRVTYKGKSLPFSRDADAVVITFPTAIQKGSFEALSVWYEGKPRTAINPPSDGGFVFSKDNQNAIFVSALSQGLGSSIWWPNKDHQSDEADSVLVSITTSKKLHGISNGRLRSIESLDGTRNKYNWFVSSPINTHSISVYIGDFLNWKNTFQGINGALDLDFWALKLDSTGAKLHWEKEVKRTLTAFEHWFGAYPWYKDGYKLVQAPYVGMGHQTAIAYGNQFKNGYLGTDVSGTGYGLKWDYVIVHESAHEWWGNNISAKDKADHWIHEAFATYSEVLFADYYYGEKVGNEYLRGLRRNIQNLSPLIGRYGLNEEGSPDIADKGANLIHMIRSIISNDNKFRKLLTSINELFGRQIVTSYDMEAYISNYTGINFSKVFDQYLRKNKLPTLEYRIQNNQLSYRWTSEVEGFNMPVRIAFEPGKFRFIQPSQEWQSVALNDGYSPGILEIDPNYYINIRKLN